MKNQRNKDVKHYSESIQKKPSTPRIFRDSTGNKHRQFQSCRGYVQIYVPRWFPWQMFQITILQSQKKTHFYLNKNIIIHLFPSICPMS